MCSWLIDSRPFSDGQNLSLPFMRLTLLQGLSLRHLASSDTKSLGPKWTGHPTALLFELRRAGIPWEVATAAAAAAATTATAALRGLGRARSASRRPSLQPWGPQPGSGRKGCAAGGGPLCRRRGVHRSPPLEGEGREGCALSGFPGGAGVPNGSRSRSCPYHLSPLALSWPSAPGPSPLLTRGVSNAARLV